MESCHTLNIEIDCESFQWGSGDRVSVNSDFTLALQISLDNEFPRKDEIHDVRCK